MFKVIDKRDNDIREIYAVSNDDYEPKFLYYDSITKGWKWCFASCFEPYIEKRFIIEDKAYHMNSDRIRGVITVTDCNTGNQIHKEWKTYEDGYTDREYVIEMLKDVLLKEEKCNNMKVVK